MRGSLGIQSPHREEAREKSYVARHIGRKKDGNKASGENNVQNAEKPAERARRTADCARRRESSERLSLYSPLREPRAHIGVQMRMCNAERRERETLRGWQWWGAVMRAGAWGYCLFSAVYKLSGGF